MNGIKIINKDFENIEVEYKNGMPFRYYFKSSDDLKLPSLGFKMEEDCRLILAAIKSMVAHGLMDPSKTVEFDQGMCKYIFRLFGINNEWTE